VRSGHWIDLASGSSLQEQSDSALREEADPSPPTP
jgi:hypothetical protein